MSYAVTKALAAGERSITFSADDLPYLEDPDAWPLPNRLTAMVQLTDGGSVGAARVTMLGCTAGTAEMLGRFCVHDEQLRARVGRMLATDDTQSASEPIPIEVLHCPHDHVANVLNRPAFHRLAIRYFGASGDSNERCLALDDLYVGVHAGKVRLYSKQLGSELAPQQCNALASLRRHNLPAVRFLRALQHQDEEFSLVWNWGGLAMWPHLPEVHFNDVILSREVWVLDRERLLKIGDTPAAIAERLKLCQVDLKMPPSVLLACGATEELLIDLADLDCVRLVRDEIHRRGIAVFVRPPDVSQLSVRSSAGRHIHQIIIPFVNKSRQRKTQERVSPRFARSRVAHPPGDCWLYYKLYVAPHVADRVLLDLVQPLVDELRFQNALDAWFFLRYADPDFHIRFRIHGSSSSVAHALRAVNAMANSWYVGGIVRDMSIHPYEPEVDRYGGPTAVKLAERVFSADSDCTLANLTNWRRRNGDNDDRLLIAMEGVDALLGDASLKLAERAAVVHGWCDRLDSSPAFRAGSVGVRRSLRARATIDRRLRSRAVDLLRTRAKEFGGVNQPKDAFAERSNIVRPLLTAIREDEGVRRLANWNAILSSLTHMHVNRILSTPDVSAEHLIYDLLSRAYSGLQAQGRRSVIGHDK